MEIEIHFTLENPLLPFIKKSLYLTIPLCPNEIKGKEGAKNEVGITK